MTTETQAEQTEVLAERTAPTETTDERAFCAVHTNVETALRCNRCGRYMCPKCAVHTPVGYRCRECVYQQESGFYKGTTRDNLLAFAVSLPLAALAGLILPRFLFLILIGALPVGALISEAVLRVTGKRRTRQLWLFVAAAVIIGCLIGAVPLLAEAGGLFEALEQINALPPATQAFSQVAEARNMLTRELLTSYALPIGLNALFCAFAAAARLR